ncbi:MAG: hypothetical protein HOH19_11955 [Kordiimonadaceae bacterium]|jgi:hypothetical protein|nr:hypothetical protein [Kordiimonadaceae bacterium]MBT6033283.1 hypothetical protein [Kordiimonadaceae bacterium]
MINEALQHLFILAPKHIKKMGYVKESIAIEARAKRCQQSWAPHLEECKKQILAATSKLAPGSTIMLLGSGGLHDVPMEDLREFKLICVDIVHLPETIKLYPDVEFINKDVTGVIEPLYKAVKNKNTFFPDPDWILAKRPNLIISLNILSQLALKPVGFAKRHKYELGDFFHDNILKAHVNWLKRQKTNVLMISDINRDYYQGEKLIETEAAIPTLDIGAPKDTWNWDVAPKGEVDNKINIRHVVGAWEF